MNDVIVGVDGSPSSRCALEWALGVARARGVTLRVVTAWQYPAMAGSPLGPSALSSPDEMERSARDAVESMVDDVCDVGASDVEIQVDGGPAANVILRAAADDAAAMLVVGARGLGGFEGLLLGSVSQQCLEYATCPVVIIRGSHPPALGADARYVVGLDGSDGAGRARDWAVELVADTGGEIVAVHAPGAGALESVLDEARDALQQWCDPIQARGVSYSSKIDAGDPRTVLQHAADDEDAALVVLGSRGLGSVRALMVGGVTAYLARHGSRSVAVVPPAQGRGR